MNLVREAETSAQWSKRESIHDGLSYNDLMRWSRAISDAVVRDL